ncbi:amino acid-binding protein [Ktedonobacteria bacterium brp13]|nr:amino acid-binding protein [Ktedonobacteria bacterium brp13]
MQKLTLYMLPQLYAFCRLQPNGAIPHWALLGDDFISLTRTHEELSVVCLQENVPSSAQAERDWRCIKVEGPFGFSVSGVHASLALPLAEASISVMAIATYETDHLLIKSEDVEAAIETLKRAGHTVRV